MYVDLSAQNGFHSGIDEMSGVGLYAFAKTVHMLFFGKYLFTIFFTVVEGVLKKTAIYLHSDFFFNLLTAVN